MQSLNINNQEQSSIAQYIKEHDTAVLTVMFTDIQGFTEITEEKGDQLATELRSKHDKILTDIIQKNNAGLVIKFIGDAVMAVFAEPSAAIDKSIQIQNAIEEFNQQENDLPSIKIRIGLHMGQVTVEENVQIDVFGRHVNRAARIESLAQGGQILMSYSVFDSAQGWFVAQKNIASVEHGLYQLKGIKGSVQIFEVYDPRATKPVTPSKGKITTKSTKTKLVTGILSAIVTVLIVFTLQWYQAVELRLESFYPENMRLADNSKLTLAGNQEDASRLVTNEMDPGPHLIYYPVGKNLRYYAELDLNRGLNQLKPTFKEWRLPSAQYRLTDDQLDTTTYTHTRNLKFYIQENQRMVEKNAQFAITVKRKIADEDIANTILITIVHDKKTILDEELSIDQQTMSKIKRLPKKTLWRSDLFDYQLDLYTAKGSIDISILGVFN